MVQFKILFEGYSTLKEDGYFANCSCVLIKGSPNVIVDTMTSWDSEKLLDALKNEGLSPQDINYVISTHGHSDHIGCNHLFKKATHIVGFNISHKDKYFMQPDFRNGEEFVISEDIKIISTPGHTLQDVSVILKTAEGIVGITGDLFEKFEDLNDDSIWINAGSDNEALQQTNRQRILDSVDFIIPGHGPMFRVPKI